MLGDDEAMEGSASPLATRELETDIQAIYPLSDASARGLVSRAPTDRTIELWWCVPRCIAPDHTTCTNGVLHWRWLPGVLCASPVSSNRDVTLEQCRIAQS